MMMMMMSQDAAWHKLTLEELIGLTSSKCLTDLAKEYDKRPDRVQLFLNRQSSTAELDTGLTPPRPCAQDDLNSYIILRWCPWFSQTFGVLSEENLNMLTVRLLRLNSQEAPILLELLTAVLLVLKQPNVPRSPPCHNPTLAETFLFSS